MDDFFGPLPDPDVPHQSPPRLPAWCGPPDDVLPGIVPDRRVVAASDDVAVVLRHIDAYPEGCALHLEIHARRPTTMDDRDWWDLHELLFNGRYRRGRTPGPLEDETLRLGIELPDGTRRTADDHTPLPDPEGQPSGPVLIVHDAGALGGHDRVVVQRTLWLWPLPPAQPFQLAVAWVAADIDLTTTWVDGAATVAAAGVCEPLLPRDDR